MVGLQHVSKCVARRNLRLQTPRADISRFAQTRHHGIWLRPAATQWQSSIRCYGGSSVIRPDEKTQQALDIYKQALHPIPWDKISKLDKSLDTASAPQDVSFSGYLMTRRDVSKKLSFAILRDVQQKYAIQVVSSANAADGQAAEAHACLKSLREWTPVVIHGTLMERAQPKRKAETTSNPEGDEDTTPLVISGTREISLKSITPLNEIPNDIIVKEEATYGAEQRHLQLRTDSKVRSRIIKRGNVALKARCILDERGFTEVETPLLFKSTPEGAREFLVPTRTKGLAYALPQSPQQYKQILMASGILKYFQFARCFRDEDLRADRQPEFTQLDMEMSFASEEQVMAEIEHLVREIWSEKLNIAKPIARMQYQEAMSSYGSDKPDLRYPAKIHHITDRLDAGFISKITPLEDATIDAFKMQLSDDPKKNRKFISEFFSSPEGAPFLQNPHGQPATFVGDAAQPMGGLGPLGYGYTMEQIPDLETEHGDLLVIQARPAGPFTGGSTTLGNLRLALYKAAAAQGLIEPPAKDDFQFLWITDFPLFSPTVENEPGQGGTAGLASTHHPFTAPKTSEDVDLLLTDPTKAVAAHYDLVVNGVELGGGSRRIHNAEVQEFIFREVLKMAPERVEDFRHLLDVLRSGCPPHAGIALGWDRLMAMMVGSESVRDVIAFPKTGSGEDVLVKSPNAMTSGQLATYHLKLEE